VITRTNTGFVIRSEIVALGSGPLTPNPGEPDRQVLHYDAGHALARLTRTVWHGMPVQGYRHGTRHEELHYSAGLFGGIIKVRRYCYRGLTHHSMYRYMSRIPLEKRLEPCLV